MIKYDRLWKTMKERGISQYDLYEHYHITKSLLDRFRKNLNTEVYTLDRICTILDCNIEDIVEHVPDEPQVENEISDERKIPDSALSKLLQILYNKNGYKI